MDEKQETLQAEDQLAISDPQAYLVSNPTPRDWNLSTQDIARSIKIEDPRQILGLTKEDIQGPRKLNMLETFAKGVWDSITDNPIKESNETRMFYSSPNMTADEAERLMNDVLYTDYKRREAETIKSAEELKYKTLYGFSNGVGSAIKYAFLGFAGGPVAGPAMVGAVAGAESSAQVETELADRYMEKYGKDYTKKEMWKDTGLASAYGVFAGVTEAALGVERIAAGALGRYSKLEALSRLARMQGKTYKSGALKALRRGGMGGAEEGFEELLQNPAEDLTVALAGYAEDITTDSVFKKAFTSALFGALIGGTMGWGLYRINRKTLIDKINKWNTDNKVGLNDQQVREMTDQMLDDGKTKMLDEVATRVEIRNHYGKAYELVKKRLLDQIEATGTVPWQDKAKTKEEYVETLADTITPPAIFVANKLNIPLTDFLEIADVESWVIGNVIGFKPITSIADIDEIIAKQDAIIKDQREKKKLGIGNEQVLSDAQRRKAIAQRVRREVAQDQEIAKRRSTSKKQTADYITARDVQPVSVEALAGATTAEAGQDFVLVAGKKIPVEYQVVELSTVQPSHINGVANPNYTNEQLQNRASRGTVQDVADLREKASVESFTPERLMKSATSAEGAPVVNAAGEVIAGNGRTEIVRYAYENPETAEKYKKSLSELGFNIEGMSQPILIRRNTTLTPDEQIAAADISNISETSAFDEASQARRDTQYLKDSPTPTEFAAKLPMSDRRGLMQNNGKWNKRRVQQRYESALLSWLCGNDTQLFENLVLDRGISQKIIDVLTANGNLIYETATKYPELELREDIYNALVKMQYTNRDNFLEMTQQLSLDGHDVMPENILVWNWLYADGTTNRQFMNYYATTLANNQERVNAGEDMFGQKVAPLSKKDALMQALKKSDQAKAEMSASNGRKYEPLFDENGTTNNPELLAAIISYNNQFAPTSNLNKIAYTSGKTFYLTPSTRFVLRGGEGQIVHGWGLYLLENMLENARLYRNKFNTGLIYVENMPEENKADQIMAYNGLVGENAKKFKEYLSYVLENRPGWTANEGGTVSKQIAVLANITEYMHPLINESETPTTAYFATLAKYKYDDPNNKYIRKQKDGKYKFVIPKDLPLGIRDVLQLTNKKIASAGWYDPYVVLASNLESWLPDGNVSMFVDDLIDQAKKTPLNQAIKEYTKSILRRDNLEPRTTKTPRIAPNLTDEENVQMVKKSYVLGPIVNDTKQTDPTTRAKILIEVLRGLETDSVFNMDYNILIAALNRSSKDGPTEMEISESSPFMMSVYELARKDFNVNFPTYEQIDAEVNAVIQNQEEQWKYELLSRETLKTIFGDDISEEFENTARNYIVDMVMKGTNPFQPKQGYNNIDLEQTTATILDSNHQSDYIQMIAETIRRIYDGKTGALDEIVTMMPTLYEGFWGLYALEQTWRNMLTEEDANLMNRIAKGEVTFENLETDEDYKTMKGLTEAIPTFATSVLERAKKIYKANTDKDAQPDTKTWAAISDAIKTITDEEKTILNKKFKLDDKDRELFFKILTNPSGIKKTRGQQLEIEIPNADSLLSEEQFLADQAAAPKIREFLRSFVDVAPDPTAYLEKGGQSLKDNAYAIKLGVKFTNIADWTEEVRNAAFDFNLNETDITPEKQAELQKKVDDWVSYIMEHMRGENLYRMVMDTLPDMISYLSDGTEIGGDIDNNSQKLYDPDENPTFYVLGNYVTAQNAKEASMWLNDFGIKGITYRGGTDGRGYVIFSDESVQTLRRIDDELPMYYQKRGRVLGQYDPELQTIMLGKYWNELTLVHEMHHRYLELLWGYFKQAQAGQRTMPQDFINDLEKLFGMLEIDPNQESLTTVQQEKFTYMVEAYLTGLGVENRDNLAFQKFLHWVPEKYKSIMDLGYLDENNIIQNPMLDEESIAWFNKWFASPFAPSLPSSPDAQRMINPTDNNGELLPADQKTMNNREKEWGQDSEEQLKADAQLWRAIDENMPGDARAAIDGEKELMKAEIKNLPDDTKLPEPPKQTFRERWFKARVENARERAATMAREYLNNNPDHARELAFADPEISVEYDAPVDRGMLIRAVMETVPQGSDEWYILNDNLAMVKSMSGSALALSGDQSHQAYLDAKREIEAARELKAATNYAGTRKGAMEKWDSDIKAFIARRTEAILATEPGSEERKTAIKAMLEEAKTKFSANTTNAILNQIDLTGMRTQSTQVFIKWAEKQIKQAAHARIDTKEQQELMKASIAAQLALRDIDSTEQKDGKFVRAAQSGKDIRHWQYVKDKMKKAYIGRWGKFGIFMDNLFGSYTPSALLMSVNTLFFANVPSTAVNTATIRIAAKGIGENKVDNNVQKDEIHRIKQIFNATGINLAQMDKPTSPSTLHGEKYMNTEQKHWYNFTFEILGRTDNEFRVPTFVDTLARIATKNANGDKARATALFKEYCRLNTTSDEAKIARKQALAVANMAVFTQDGIMASALNHIRSALNTITRAPLGLDPNGFGLGNILAPFLKTGVNITEMGLNATFAPLRLAIMEMKKLQGKQIPEIDKIALRSDWINLAWMSVVLAVLAMINSDDDKWYEEPYQTGRTYDPNKPYDSIRFGDVWVKLDIFGPLAIPLRAALKMVQEWEKKKLDAVADGLFFGGMEALSDTPLVNQFTDNNLDYMTKNPGAYWSGFGYNQLNKFVPAQVKTLSRAASRGYNVEMNADWMGKTISKKFHRNYGLDGQRMTTNDLINILTNRIKVKVEK